MLTSVKVGNAFIDLRTVAVLMSGFLGGPVSAIVTIGLSLFFRFQLGGPFLLPAICDGCGGAARRRRECARRQMHLAHADRLRCRTGAAPHVDADAVLPARQSRPRDRAGCFRVTLSGRDLLFRSATVAMGGLLKFEGKRADQTADLKSENAILSERDARFQAVFDLSSVAMLWTAKDSRIVRANQRMADLVGYTVEELEGMRYEELIFPEDREEYYRIRDDGS